VCWRISDALAGSGKTASFVIPMLAYISKLPRMSEANRHLGPYALIIAPTRELAQQIEVETRKFTESLGYTVVSIVGGRDMNEQSFNLRDGAEIVVATPGRLKDCVERHVLVLSQCLYLVLDEADKSVGLGFADQLDYILDSMPASNLKPDTDEAEDPTALVSAGDIAGRYRVTSESIHLLQLALSLTHLHSAVLRHDACERRASGAHLSAAASDDHDRRRQRGRRHGGAARRVHRGRGEEEDAPDADPALGLRAADHHLQHDEAERRLAGARHPACGLQHGGAALGQDADAA
jgi:hypothetical protein